MGKSFSKRLLQWFGSGKRDMPWKKTKNPYHIWISEIILQQTRVSQGHDYYLKFIQTFPNIKVLANASEDEVLQCWKGLGYYSRARNIHFTAKYIEKHHEGIFPVDYKSILALKGIGPYSAAAIASFAFDLPYAVADGNVYRVLSRYLGIQESIDSTKIKKHLSDKANELIDPKRPADFNQAIMDLGAMICIPSKPQCSECPLKKDCVAFNQNLTASLPIRDAKKKKKHRYFNYLVVEVDGSLLMKRRSENDVWKGLFDFPLVESSEESPFSKQNWIDHCSSVGLTIMEDFDLGTIKSTSQLLTHQKIHARFYPIRLKSVSFAEDKYQFIQNEELDKIAVPKLIDWYLNDKTITLF